MTVNHDIINGSVKKQKHLGEKGFVILVALLSAFIPLSIDLYLPALPRMAENFHVGEGSINLTLIFFFVFYAVGCLFWGPLSDKYGRKRILLSGLIIFIISSILCAIASNVYQLILWRICQASGSGAVVVVAIAMVKDVYIGRKRESVLALVESMVMLSPIIAPSIGAFILRYTSWRGVFWILAAIGLCAMAGVIALEETIERRYTGNILQSMGRLKIVIRNPAFTSLLLTFSLMTVPVMAFISASSYIYINGFGLGEQVYSYYFAANALFSVVGPLFYIKISKYYKRNSIITAGYIVIFFSGILIYNVGSINPWLCAMSLVPATFASFWIYPPSLNLMLEQQKKDTGAAVSLISFTFNLMGSAGIVLISLNWDNRIPVIGLMNATAALVCLLLWLLISQKIFIREVSNEITT